MMYLFGALVGWLLATWLRVVMAPGGNLGGGPQSLWFGEPPYSIPSLNIGGTNTTIDSGGNIMCSRITASGGSPNSFLNGVQVGDSQAYRSVIYGVSGVPSNSLGMNGDFALRQDTPGTANQRMYIKSAGAWTALTL